MAIDFTTIVGLLRNSTDFIKASKEIIGQTEERLIDKIASHLRSIEVWSGQIQFIGMSASVSTDKTTIPIRINSHPRKFVASNRNLALSESDIISSGDNFLILGDPGSGKTTIVKRMLRAILLGEPLSQSDSHNFPMLIIAREIEPGQSIIRSIADELGLEYEFHEPQGSYYYQGKRLENLIIDFLNESKVALFVDGIDEISSDTRSAIEPELERLARGNGLKIIATCRSGDYGARQIEGFDVVEIAPLRPVEIKRIAGKWANNSEEFLLELSKTPYRDAADRPLFLTQLIQVYNAFSRLPPRPADVYQKIVTLSLETWDRERRVVRKSKYAHFDSERKLDFLAAISFALTYELKTKSFSDDQLQKAYSLICEKFDLPKNKADEVCIEVQGHSGLIVKSYNHFEFSHLSLQEYLCAYHMVRLPFEPTMAEYLVEYPAPVAVAVSISSEPSLWLASLIFNAKRYDASENSVVRFGDIPEESALSLISRLIVEGPLFSSDALLGLAVLRLLSSIRSLDRLYKRRDITSDNMAARSSGKDTAVLETVKSFLSMRGILASMNLAFEIYYFDPAENMFSSGNTFIMRRGIGGRGRYSERFMQEIHVGASVVRLLEEQFAVKYQWLTAEGQLTRRELPF